MTKLEHRGLNLSRIELVDKEEIGKLYMKPTLDDDIFVVKFDANFTQAEIWDIYKTSFSQPLIVNHLGTWSEKDGMNLTTLHKYERRRNLMVRNL